MVSKLSENYRRIIEITVKLIDRIRKKNSLWIAYDLNISVAITFSWTISQFLSYIFNQSLLQIISIPRIPTLRSI